MGICGSERISAVRLGNTVDFVAAIKKVRFDWSESFSFSVKYTVL